MANTAAWVRNIALPARDQMDMAVEDRLTGDLTDVGPEVESLDRRVAREDEVARPRAAGRSQASSSSGVSEKSSSVCRRGTMRACSFVAGNESHRARARSFRRNTRSFLGATEDALVQSLPPLSAMADNGLFGLRKTARRPSIGLRTPQPWVVQRVCVDHSRARVAVSKERPDSRLGAHRRE